MLRSKLAAGIQSFLLLWTVVCVCVLSCNPTLETTFSFPPFRCAHHAACKPQEANATFRTAALPGNLLGHSRSKRGTMGLLFFWRRIVLFYARQSKNAI